MAPLVYSLCMLTALISAILLLRGYLRSRAPLLFWSSLCFFGLTASNAVLFLDLLVFPEVDLFALRIGLGLVSIGVLLYGLIWEPRS
ncbi:MAG: DUF5985 family protein [Candidatus Sumerlaeaceae bacterium]